MLRLRILIVLLLYLLPISYSQANESKVALVIGNATYLKEAPLKNPGNDASDVAAKLRGLGFDVIERNNIKMRQIGSILNEFRSKLSSGAVALVFYAGHGIQINGENYLPTVDADINVEDEVPNQSIAVKQIMDVLEDSKTRLNLVFLDACRDNPFFHSFRSSERGLARITVLPSGTLISYATRPGSVAIDGQGRNGLYTSKLLQQMDSNLPIELSLKAVASEVKAASQGKQEPWMEGSIEGDFCFVTCGNLVIQPDPLKTPVQVPFNPQQPNESIPPTIAQPVIEPPKPPVPPPPKPDPAAVGKLFWESINDSDNPADFKDYLKQCKEGRFPCDFEVPANSKLQRLLHPVPPPQPVQTVTIYPPTMHLCLAEARQGGRIVYHKR